MGYRLWWAAMFTGVIGLGGCAAFGTGQAIADDEFVIKIDDSNLVPPPTNVSYDFVLAGSERVRAFLSLERGEWLYRIELDGHEVAIGSLTATGRLEFYSTPAQIFVRDGRSTGTTNWGHFTVVFAFTIMVGTNVGFFEFSFGFLDGKLASTDERISPWRLEPNFTP